jgi:hypothetical protein
VSEANDETGGGHDIVVIKSKTPTRLASLGTLPTLRGGGIRPHRASHSVTSFCESARASASPPR